MKPALLTIYGFSLCASSTAQVSSYPPDSPKWEFQRQAEVVQYQQCKAIYLRGGAAGIKDLELRDGVIDVDIASPANCAFYGIEFHANPKDNSAEWIYLRPHKSGLPDALQYAPVFNSALMWQIYNGPDLPARSTFPGTNGSTCDLRSRVRRQNYTFRT